MRELSATPAASRGFPFLHRNQTFALGELTGRLTVSPDGFTLLACAFFRRLFIGPFGLHLPKKAFPLELLFKDPKSFVHVIVAY